MEGFDPIDINFIINNDEVKANTEKIKADLKSVGQTAEETSQKVSGQMGAAFGGAKNNGIDGSNQQLKEQDRLLKSVSDKYKSLLSESMATYGELNTSQKTLIFQYHDNIAAIDQIKLAQIELNNGFETGKVGVIEYTQAQAALSVQEAKLKGDLKGIKDALASSNQALGAQAGLINRAKPQWNGLGNSINQITRELPAFALSAQTGFLAISNNIPILADEIGRLKNKNIELTASGQKAVPVWSQVVKGLLSWGTAMAAGVVLLTVYGKDVVNWIGKLFQGKEALDSLKASQDAVNKAFESGTYKKATEDILELTAAFNNAEKGLITKDVALKQYNETLGEVLGKTDDYNIAEDNLTKKTPFYIKAMLLRAAATAAAAEAANLLLEKQKEINQLEEDKKEIANPKEYDPWGYNGPRSPTLVPLKLDNITAEIKEKSKELDEETKTYTDIIAEFQVKIQKAITEGGLNFDKPEPKKPKVVNAYQNLLDKLAELDKEYARKSYTKDEEEMQALKDKFAEVRNLVQRFNADPKNKAQIIDLSNLDKLEGQATETLGYRQNTEKLKVELDAQKKLFADFEEYKKQFGQKAAEDEFSAKITTAKTYYEYLKEQQKANASAYEAVDKGTATGGETERVSFINKELEAETAKQKKLFESQLANLLSYQKERALKIEQFQTLYAELIKKGETEAAKILEENHKKDLENLDDTNFKKLASYQALYNGLVGMTVRQIRAVIAENKELLKNEKISLELRNAILKKIEETEALLKKNKYDNIFKYASSVAALGDAFANLGESLGSRGLADGGALLSGLGQSLGEVVTIFETMDGKSFSDLSSGDKANVVAAGVNGAINMITMFADAAAKRKQAEEEYYLAVIGFQNQYNLSLNEQIRLRSVLEEGVFIKDYEGRIKDALGSLGSANEEYQKALDNLANNGQAKTGQRNAVDWGNVGKGASSGAVIGAAIGSVVPVIGTLVGGAVGAVAGAIAGLFGGKKKEDKYTDILTEYPELIEKSEDGLLRINKALAESLIANNLVNKETKQILENILEWEKAMEEARAQIKEVITELTGSLGTDLKNVLVDAFVSGEDAAIKMGETIEKVLENVLSSLIFNAIFEDAFKTLEDQMAASFDIGGDGSWTDDFANFFGDATALTDDFNAAMAAAQAEAAGFGFDVFQPDNAAQQGGAGDIRRSITEDTGSEIVGLVRGSYDVTRNLFRITEEYYEKERENYGSILSLIAINTKIETNTANTVLELKAAVKVLEQIASNTHDIWLQDV